MNHPNTLSEQLLLAVKMKQSYAEILETLANIPQEDLEKQLLSDKYKIAFWINIYNSFFQILRKDRYLKQPKIYTAKQMTVAGQQLSLDDIEHGILRRFRYKYSLGYLPNIFVSALIKKWAVTAMDFRIHFALNCGAKSCPPIAFYNVDQLEEQLDLASTSFNQIESHLDHEKKVMHISRLFLWFLKDFGGTTGTRKIISKSLDQDLTAYKISYKPYSWEEHLDNYDEKRFSS
ncbi:DUF547 domain-containing protein [Lutimonas sp.]|uniref:DUF547 domain-containing protein n=1 Tax=Lutimonas sp. TaxID=1872403 RepID=UPI003C76950B